MILKSERLIARFNRAGVHPFASFEIPNTDGTWSPAAILGARQLRHAHKGASFPRVVCERDELESTDFEFEESGGAGKAASIIESRGPFEISSTAEIEGEGGPLHVTHSLTSLRDARLKLNRVFDRFDFVAAGGGGTGSVDYCFTPHLRPSEGMVIGDHVFRSPAVMIEDRGVFFALVPDLELLERAYSCGSSRYYMDMVMSGGENYSPAVSFGLGRTRVSGHVYFRSDFQKPFEILRGDTVSLGYYLFVGRRWLDRGHVLAFLWERFGRRHLSSGLPQVVDMGRCVSAGLNRVFKRPDLFKQFELEGQQCGGTVAMHLVTRKGVRLMEAAELNMYLRFQDLALLAQRTALEWILGRKLGARLLERAVFKHGPRVPPQVMFQSWFNNLRTAYGAYWFGRKWNDAELLERALSVKNLAVLAPREEGAFPAVCYITDEGLSWSRGTRGFKHIDWYHTADCATTAYYMALWYRDHEGDPRLIAACHDLADFLLKVQLPSGAFPAWVRPSYASPRVSPELKQSATTACPAMFLALLNLLEGDDRYVESVKRACRFMASEVLPRQKWFDYETFFSCSRKRIGLFDGFTGSYAQNTMSMYWAAEAFRLLYVFSGEREHLEPGREVLEHLCLYQQVWDPPFLSIDAFGGFGVMNTDGEWNDARQALVSPLLMDYYVLTGRDEYFERGIAALRASFTTMYLEENHRVAPGNASPYHFDEIGSVAENYGHFGYDHRTGGYLESDWGAGSACQAAAYIQRHYGDIYVDAERGNAFGINGCRVDRLELEGDEVKLGVTRQVGSSGRMTIRLGDRDETARRVIINGRLADRVSKGEYSVLL